MFDINAFPQTFYLGWPVAAHSIRLDLNITEGGCYLLANVRGCALTEKLATEFLPPSKWKLAFQSYLNPPTWKKSWKIFGVVNEKGEARVHGSKLKREVIPLFKSELLDLLPFLSEHSVEVKVEHLQLLTMKKVSSWILQISRCRKGFDKFFVLDLTQKIEFSQSKGNGTGPSNMLCHWTKMFSKPEVASEADLFMKVFFRRVFDAVDAFHLSRHMKLNQSTAFTSLLVSSHSECAQACLGAETLSCNSFDICLLQNTTKHQETQYKCSLATYDALLPNSALYRHFSCNTYILKDILRSRLPITPKTLHQIKIPVLSNPGYQCQCINHVTGRLCNNNTTHDRTYHVITTSPFEIIKLDCSSENASSAIRIQFALLGQANDVTAMHFPFNFRNGVVNTMELVKGLCDSRKVCIISIEKLSSLVPPANYSYLEIRSVCEKLQLADNLFKSSKPNNSTRKAWVNYSNFNLLSSSLGANTTKVTTRSTSAVWILFRNSTLPAKAETVVTDGGLKCPPVISAGIVFPASGPGVVKGKCPKGADGNSYLRCFNNLTWSSGPPDATQCTSKWLDSLSEMVSNASRGTSFINASNIARLQLQSLQSQKQSRIFPNDIIKNTQLAEKLLELQINRRFDKKTKAITSADVDETVEFSQTLQVSVDSLLDQKYSEVWTKLNLSTRSSAAYNLTKTFETAAILLARSMTNQTSFSHRLDNSIFQVNSVSNASNNHENRLLQLTFSPSSNSARDWDNNAGGITVSFGHESFVSNGVVFALYKDVEQLLGDSFKFEGKSKSKTSSREDQAAINSHVISATKFAMDDDGDDASSQQSVKIVLRHKKLSSNTTRCVFWKALTINMSHEPTHSGGYWSDDECSVVKSNLSHTVCNCQHLTHFAILMDTVGIKLDDIHDFALTITTWIGCSLSVFCLLLSICCFNLLRNIRSVRNSIHKNLCFTLMCAQLIFLLGIDRTSNTVLCSVIAGTLHYLFLSVFAWMCVEGVHVYVSLVKVFEIDKRSRLISYYILAYGIPGLVVAISVGVRHDGYGSEKSCWLSTGRDHLIWSFVGPALAVISVNVYFFFVALRVLLAHRNLPTSNRLKTTKIWMKGSCVLLCLLGITWIFGVLNINEKMIVMAYLFTVCNALQGVFIFIFHCLLNEKIRKELMKFLRRNNLCPMCVQRFYRTNSFTSNTRSTGSVILRNRKASTRFQDITNAVEEIDTQPDYVSRERSLRKRFSLRKHSSSWMKLSVEKGTASGVIPSSDLNSSVENIDNAAENSILDESCFPKIFGQRNRCFANDKHLKMTGSNEDVLADVKKSAQITEFLTEKHVHDNEVILVKSSSCQTLQEKTISGITFKSNQMTHVSRRFTF